MFDNVLCIGDSLTVGYSGDGDAAFAKNYPHYFKKLSVADTTIKAHGGYTAKQVWDNIISVASDLDEYDCAIIYLGTNGGLTDTVSTDCNASDYTQNADTNTGCYGKIIGKILADAPDCKIFCVAGPNEYLGRDTTMNPAVRNLSAFYNVGLVDLSGCILDDNGSTQSAERYLYRPIDGIHYNILGYMTLANVIYNSVMNFMGENRSMYTG
jgi:lysophospholipase L1-like esterase